MTDQAFAQADPDWLALIGVAREWFAGPLGRQLLEEERRVLEEELAHAEVIEPLYADYSAGPASQYFNLRKLSIFGGSNEIQKNIISKMILGL